MNPATDTYDSPMPLAQGGARRLTIEFQVGVEPLTGTLYSEGDSFPFAGWLSLASVLGRITAKP